MRILVHDFSGHPFQVQLSRRLAGAGHDVLHLHCASYATGKGALSIQPEDPETFAVDAIAMDSDWDRYRWRKRILQELSYGRAFSRRAAGFEPDVVLSSNDPLFAKVVSARWCASTGTPWVFWLQDVYSAAMATYARNRLGTIGRVVGGGFEQIERRLLRHAAGVVAITEDFLPLLEEWRVATPTEVIPNWAPIDEIPTMPRSNDWAIEHGLSETRVALYSGTLGLKHDPRLLSQLAAAHPDDLTVVVISQGKGADWLEDERRRLGLGNLVLLPYQPYDRLPEALGSADVLLALLGDDAGGYSVPSKVLTYLCAGRPVVASLPSANRSHRMLEASGAAFTTQPGDAAGFVSAVEKVLEDDGTAAGMGDAARAFAEAEFDIGRIVPRFESVLRRAVSSAG